MSKGRLQHATPEPVGKGRGWKLNLTVTILDTGEYRLDILGRVRVIMSHARVSPCWHVNILKCFYGKASHAQMPTSCRITRESCLELPHSSTNSLERLHMHYLLIANNSIGQTRWDSAWREKLFQRHILMQPSQMRAPWPDVNARVKTIQLTLGEHWSVTANCDRMIERWSFTRCVRNISQKWTWI